MLKEILYFLKKSTQIIVVSNSLYIHNTEIFGESLLAPAVKLLWDEHRNSAPLSSLVTLKVIVMVSVQLSVLWFDELEISSGVKYWDIFQILIFLRGLPTLALQVKFMDWFSSSSFGVTRNTSGFFALLKRNVIH